MKLKITLTAFLLGTGAFANAQGTFVYDQQSTGVINSGWNIGATPFGQSFTPTLDSVGFVDLQLSDGPVASTVAINIRSGSITGSILGTSLPTSVSVNSLGIYDFLFSNPVILTPGTQYFFEPVVVGGGIGGVGVEATSTQYTGGDMILSGVAQTDRDLWFREGVVSAVPEPASAALFAVAGVLFWNRRKRVII